MRAIAWMLGAVAPLVLLGCVGAETETEASDEAADIGQDVAAFYGTDPTPHGRFPLVLGMCKTAAARTPCLVWPPPIQGLAR